MTRYYTNFEDSDIGEHPIGWTRWFDMDSARTAHVSAVEVGTPMPRVKRRQLRLNAANVFGFMSMDAVDADTARNNIEIHFPFKRVDVGSPAEPVTVIEAFARWSSLSGYHLALLLDKHSSPNFILVQRFEAGSVTATPIVAAFTFDSTQEYLVRWRVQDLPGSPSAVQIDVKVWLASAAEPAAYTVSAIDAGATVAGLKGLTGLHASGNSTVVKAPTVFNFFSVATNGDTAVTPRTNAEFLTFLDDQTKVKRVLATLAAAGYATIAADGNIGAMQCPGQDAYAQFVAGAGGSPTTRLIQTPDNIQNSIAGDITLMADINPDDWTNTDSVRLLLSKGDAAGTDFGYFLQVATSGSVGTLQLAWSTTGADIVSGVCTEPLPAFGQRIKVAAELDVNNGAGGWTLTFWISYDKGITWGQMGATVTGAGVTSIFNSSQVVEIGTQQAGRYPFKGKMYRAEIWNGRAINDATNAVRVTDFYPQRMNPVFVLAGFYQSRYTGELYTLFGVAIVDLVGNTMNERKAYVSNGEYATQAWDTPASTPFIPCITRVPTYAIEMGTSLALSGLAKTSFGSLGISNPTGTRDDWLRIRWKRDYAVLQLGDPSWPLHDFRTIIQGRLGQPTGGAAEITFPIGDLSDTFADRLQKNLYTSGDLLGKPKPISMGLVGFLEPVLTDSATGTYQFHDGPVAEPAVMSKLTLFDNQVAVTSTSKSVSAVNAATDTLSTATAHGFASGGSLQFNSGTPPAPLALSTTYYLIAAGLTATDFRLAATPAGAAINITGVTTGAGITYTPSTLYNNRGTFTYATSVAGRLIATSVAGAKGTETGDAADILDWLVFSKFGLSRNFRDGVVFTAIKALLPVATYQAGYHFTSNDQILMKDAIQRVCNGLNLWYGFSPEGLFQAGQFGLPASTAAMAFIESDVAQDSLQEISCALPIDFRVCPVNYNRKFLLGGALQSQDPFWAPFWTLAPYAFYGSAAPPFDNNAVRATDSRTDQTFEVIFTGGYTGEQTRLVALYNTLLGVYEFRTRHRAATLRPGQTISLTHSKKGWKQYSYPNNLSSPDMVTNAGQYASIDSTKAVVLGVNVDLGITDGFPVRVTAFRKSPGFYPTANLQ